jgi:hypothetical protein
MIPASFTRDGFVLPNQLRKGKFKRLLIGSDGWPDTGKTEFACSAPGPGLVLCLDRGQEAMLDNTHPPATRRNDFAFKIIKVPVATQMKQHDYLTHWQTFFGEYVSALDNPDARTVVVDGDSDSWELQRLAEFGRLTGNLPIQHTGANAARRAYIARAFDSGKIVIMTNKLKKGYKSQVVDGKEIQVETGKEERQGFRDQDYLYQLQLRHLYDATKAQWGVRITKCKVDMGLVGFELFGDDCNFQSLVQVVYPNVPLSEWGY